MNAAVVCLGGIAVFALGYRFYSRFLAEKVFGLRDDEPVPAVEMEDGVDYVPTNKHVLFGHHYASIAGAAPIVGPAVAVVWGWVPAVLWVVFGTVFMGAVHDFSVLVLSTRHGAKSIGTIVAEVIVPRTRALFQLVIFCLVMLVIAVFTNLIAGLFVSYPGTVIPINFEIVVAVVIGYICYKRGAKLLWPSIAALVSLYAAVWVGVEIPVSLEGLFGEHTRTAWVVGLLVYALVASTLPVWLLLQPRDYINSHQLFVGLFALIAGILIAHPEIQAPAFQSAPPDAPSSSPLPFLFVTIACGAISGFHGLVSSGTTSKQLCRAPDARMVGYGGMLGEGLLALIATLAVTAGISDWGSHYHSFAAAGAGKLENFVAGAGNFISALGIPVGPAQIVAAVLAISFAATSLDTGVRIQRYLLQEIGKQYRIAPLTNPLLAAGVAVALPFGLIISGKAVELWILFGSSNQLLAGLSLTVVTVWLFRLGRPIWPAAIPTVIIMVLASIAMTIQIGGFVARDKYLLAFIGALVLALQAWVVLEGLLAMRSESEKRATETSASATPTKEG
jgi:carbon starvation protein